MQVIPFPTEPLKDAEWTPVAPEKIISGQPKSALKILYTSKSGDFTAGIYECTAGKWKTSYTEDEFITLIEGRLRLTHDNGEVQEFKAPDSFLIPAGFSGIWEPLGHLRKFFVIYEKSN
ncbi:MAG: cupin domain-containing protein [Alphaproteobacteria bacterium]|nr:cupin domain-containing protein [Alphaproteobacteria bacterium]